MEAQGFLTYRRVAKLTGVTAIAVGRWALTGKLASIAVGHRLRGGLNGRSEDPRSPDLAVCGR